MSDTPLQIEQFYTEMLLSRTPEERLRIACRMYDSAKKLVISRIKSKKKQLTSSRLRGLLFLRIYGNDFTITDRKRIIESIPDMEMDNEYVRDLKMKNDRLLKGSYQATCNKDNNLNDEWEKASLEKWE